MLIIAEHTRKNIPNFLLKQYITVLNAKKKIACPEGKDCKFSAGLTDISLWAKDKFMYGLGRL